jgi:hypothetical protein
MNSTLVAAKLHTIGPRFKKVSSFIKEDDILNLVTTCEALSQVGIFDTMINVNGVMHPLSDYEIDSHLKGFVSPRKIELISSDHYSIDLKDREDFEPSLVVSPAEFKALQYQLLGCFKAQPSFIGVKECLDATLIANIQDFGGFIDGNIWFHISDIRSLKAIPPLILNVTAFARPDYFETTEELVYDSVVTNILASLV